MTNENLTARVEADDRRSIDSTARLLCRLGRPHDAAAVLMRHGATWAEAWAAVADEAAR
jgi:hypothetical protein